MAANQIVQSGLSVTEPAGEALILLAHGSLEPKGQDSIEALARAVRLAHPGRVEVAYLRHAHPHANQLLGTLAEAGITRVVVVPVLLTAAYHARVDLPQALSVLPPGVAAPHVTQVLGGHPDTPDPRVLAALRRRLAELDLEFDGVVLAAAGSGDTIAHSSVVAMADALGASLNLPCRASFASLVSPTPGDAVAQLQAAGAHRVVVASFCIVRGQLFRVSGASATAAGAVGVAAPLGDAPELVELVLERLDDARREPADLSRLSLAGN